MAAIWDEIRDFFDTDDGSLPEIRIENLSGDTIVKAYAWIRSNSTLISVDAQFWHVPDQSDKHLDVVPNATALVVAGVAEPFHFLAGGLSFQGTVIPDLGVFIFQDAIFLDYRMGPAWGEREVVALFELLRKITGWDSNATISLEEYVIPEMRQDSIARGGNMLYVKKRVSGDCQRLGSLLVQFSDFLRRGPRWGVAEVGSSGQACLG